MTRNTFALPIIAFALLCSCKRLAPRPSDSTAPAPEPATSAPPASPPIPPLSDTTRIEDERNTIAVFRDSAPAVVFVTQTRVVVDYLAGTAQEVPAGSGSGFVWDEF